MSEMPGRHTWYNQEYNQLLCEAGAIMGDEAQRNELYRTAERILIEDVALVPIYHGIFQAMVKPDIKGPMLEPGEDGVITWMRHLPSRRQDLPSTERSNAANHYLGDGQGSHCAWLPCSPLPRSLVS
jgi:hypothetical protein